MSLNTFKQIQRTYGVDFGTRSISISKVDIDVSPFTPDGNNQTSYLSDQIGKTTIFNGVQYVRPPAGADALTSYKVRRMGNECGRSRLVDSILNWDDPDFDPDDSIVITTCLPESSGSTVEVDREVRAVSIVTHIRELIDRDMETDPIASTVGKPRRQKVVFALPELTPKKRTVLQWRIDQIFNAEPLDNDYDLEFITETNAVAFARFNQAYPNYIQCDTTCKEPSSETILILKSGHSKTEVLEVETAYHDLRSVYRVIILNRLTVPLGGRTLDRKINWTIGSFETSKEVENIKHDLSMYDTTFYDDDGRGMIRISRDRLMDDEISGYLEDLQNFILRSNATTIELVGGNTRSFVIQNLLKSIENGYSIRRGLSADEATALGAGVYGAVLELSQRSNMRVEFDRRFDMDTQAVEVKSPWIDRVGGAEEIRHYVQGVEFSGSRMDLSRQDVKNGLKMMRARDLELGRGDHTPSEVRMITIKGSDRPNRIIYKDLRIDLDISPDWEFQNSKRRMKYSDFTADLFLQFNLLDVPEVVAVTQPGISVGYDHTLDYGERFSERTTHSASDMVVEAEIRHFQRLYERIGSLYNRMEAFFFDRDAYRSKKQSILDEINRVKSAYAYAESTVDRLEADYKKLLDTYEFCRVLTVDPDMMDDPNYRPDPEVGIDTRLTREAIDQIVKDEKGLEMLEGMIGSI
jgi:hypothetical protein